VWSAAFSSDRVVTADAVPAAPDKVVQSVKTGKTIEKK